MGIVRPHTDGRELYSTSDLNVTYSDEHATVYRDKPRDFENVAGRVAIGSSSEKPSLVRRVVMLSGEDAERARRMDGCTPLHRIVSDRLRLSIRAKNASGPGDFDVEIWSIDSLAARCVFRGRFNFDNILGANKQVEEWLVTIAGEPSQEWLVGISFEAPLDQPAQGAPPTVKVETCVIVDRAGCAPGGGDGSSAPSILLNRGALVDVSVPAPEDEFAQELSIANPAYTLAVPDVSLSFVPDNISFAFTTPAAAEVWVSFDGTADHIHMVNGTPTSSFTMPTHRKKWWVRAVAGAPVPLQVLATQDREF